MLCVPAVKLLVVQPALGLLPPPASATALQPLMAVPSLVKLTFPPGLAPVTVALNVTLVPAATGEPEVDSVVVLGGRLDAATPHASTSVISDQALRAAVTLMRIWSVVKGAKLTVRLTRLLPLTV